MAWNTAMLRSALAALVVVSALTPAVATDVGGSYPTPRGDHGALPACDAPSVLGYIRNQFAWADRNTWHIGLTIDGFDMIEETGAKIYTASLIDRVNCRGRVLLSNGQEEPVFYLIESKTGFAGHGSHVTFCLPEFDHYRAYDAWCRTVRP